MYYLYVINNNKFVSNMILKKNKNLKTAREYYNNIVMLSRNRNFYLDGGVPDSIDGRFELIVLHVYIFVSRLLKADQEGRNFSQKLIEIMIEDFDSSLREIGVGDLSVGKKVKYMVSSYYGRVSVYDKNISDFNGKFVESLKNNLFGTVIPEAQQIDYILKYILKLNLFLNKIDNKSILECFDNFSFEKELYINV